MRRKEMGKLFVLAFICITLLTTTGIGVDGGIPVLSQAENTQLTALLGDLDGEAPRTVRDQVGALLHQVQQLAQAREAEGNYEMSEEETTIWKKITAQLDAETIRQFGEYTDDEPEEKAEVDYGKTTMSNLKGTLSRTDWNALNTLREDYFKAVEEDDEAYDVDVEAEMKSIITKYKRLDADAVVLNLLDDKNQKNQGLFYITANQQAVYQEGWKNGLDTLTWKEQKKLAESWQQVTAILPKDWFAPFQYFKVGGDGVDGTYAYVIPVDDRGERWCMAVDPADITEDGLFPYTVVHEMCHYWTLNEKQVEYLGDQVAYYPAERYSDWECVAKEDSYLQAFYQAFWQDIINDWATDPENLYFYDRHQSEFVTGYASTNCAEDLAESFSAYVFLKSADTPEVQAKLDFFDSYPELRQKKKEILKMVKENKVYVNPQIEPYEDKHFAEEI
ncbi:hypothetical protein Ami103574_02100 [Aminipila butyrica]|uniref:Uncharacterized protein n=1 Tax=Aminipila butyrica TaxID=433296 RepID=A0A858BSU0_9FIRM|nr:hypothetical protein [Aminipila butyrica]QIB68175.1 hypothetical protein Ami103574_02100 [Aminipila butyrica]